ncbi:Protein HIR2 [Debaryomyces fabryi]|uniref:Protein HIR n=1 Tax=Debaryomyces fabryi TaxID=58627 RepID=A0A0V1Q4B5_9ASCO|nr:Protein HIR2 [Debaryomyces fabryi]KSA03341.1 Protein HIR2 [Debaryomyces fabryi]CUM49883.1 unnamed protein product [Debaryomyces fabryi]
MRVLVLPSVLHSGQIHSIDVNKNNSKILTSGLDKEINVWSLQEFIRLNTEENDKIKENLGKIEPLARITVHEDLVNIVKWCPQNEHVFASGDVQGKVYMHDISKDTNELIFPFGLKEERTSRVVDLSWSNDGRLLAWSTADSKIHIYDTEKATYQDLTSLSNLEKLTVQRSIAFDPTNSYLISMGDDTLIYLYQYQYEATTGNYQFRLINRISKLINKTSLNVDYKRISWSPDGEYVSVPTASKNQTSLISLLSRSNGWNNILSLVGHNLDCEVVQYSPKIYNYSDNTENPKLFNVIATAGSDMTLVVWNTTKDKPIFILKEVSKKPIVDLCWDKTGSSLFVASLDGHLSIISFQPQELGNTISDELWEKLFEMGKGSIKPFNEKSEQDSTASTKKGSHNTIDILDQKNSVNVEEAKAKIITDGANDSSSVTPEEDHIDTETSKQDSQINDKQVTNFVPDIIPAIIEDAPKTQDILHSAMNTTRISKPQKNVKEKSTKVALEKAKITTKNGKKRIQPMLISSTNENNSNIAVKKAVIPESNGSSSLMSSGKVLMEFDKPSYSVSDDLYKQNKRTKVQDENSTKKLKRELEPVKFIGSVIVNPSTTFARIRLSIPKVRLNFQLSSTGEENCVFDVKNGLGNETKPSRITFFKKEKQIWCDFIPRFVQLVTEGSVFWAVSTADGQILTYSRTSGKKLLPPIILGSPLSFLESHGKFLMAVTSIGELFVWDIEQRKIHLQSNLSLSALLDLSNKYQEDGLSKSDNITMCSITNNGIPLLTLSNGTGYLFNRDLGVWQTISESWWAFGSHYWDSLGNDDGSKPQSYGLFGDSNDSSIVGLLEQKTNELILRKTRAGRGKYFNKISKNMLMKEGFENLENTISLSHLENRILCCELLGEFKDFHDFFIIYVKRICELGFKAKLFEVCDQLLGPSELNSTITGESEMKWSPEICGLKKHDLLKEVILSCAKNRDCQRILIHFGKKIGVVDIEEFD